MGELLETTKVLVEPVTKLIDIIQSAIGTEYEPTRVKKLADAKAYEIKTISSAIRESSDIPIIYDKGNLSLDSADFEEFVKRTQNRLACQELTKQRNIETVCNKAYETLSGTEQVTDEPLDSDWLNRLFNYIGDVSNEKMQEIWALVLSGEVKKPSSFSLRTLETLHNISQREAELFKKMSGCFIYNNGAIYLPNFENLLRAAEINYANILKMDECGLLNSSGIISSNIPVSICRQMICKNRNYILFAQSKNQKDTVVHIPQYPLTLVGREIVGLFESTTNDELFVAFSQEVKKNNSNSAEVSMHKIVSEESNQIKYDSKDLLS